MADQYNIDLTETVNEKIKGFPRTETLLKIFEIYDFDYSEFDESKLEKICDVKNETYLNLINSKLNEDYILFGIKNLLQEAKSMNLKIALASSSKNAPLILDKLKIKSYFDFIANPSDVKNSKPAPDLYLLAAKGLNLLPSECVGFEDAMIGIQGLNDADIFSVGISLQDYYVRNNSKYFVKDTKELNLKDILAKANN
ncbi:MAG: HAD-IA family hydrolase [Oscillospiraceae bacterium]